MASFRKLNCLCCCKQLVHVLCIKMIQEMHSLGYLFGLLLEKISFPFPPTSWVEASRFSHFKCPLNLLRMLILYQGPKEDVAESMRQHHVFIPGGQLDSLFFFPPPLNPQNSFLLPFSPYLLK